MKRRVFLQSIGAVSAAGATIVIPKSVRAAQESENEARGKSGMDADLVIAGGGLGGCAAALGALRNGLKVILTEETDWIGGQLTSQGVPPDEHGWIETHGCTAAYRELRNRIRDYYRNHYPLKEVVRNQEHLNPGAGSVSRLCHEPRVALAVLDSMLAPYISQGRLMLLLEHKIIAADTSNDRVRALKARNQRTGRELELEAPFFVDATELGDLLPLTRTEFVMGAEGKVNTGELHAPEERDPHNQQAFTLCFAIDHVAGEEHVIEKPRDYEFWRKFVPDLQPPWPGRLLDLTYTHPPSLQPRALGFNPDGGTPGKLNLWVYRRIISKEHYPPGTYKGDASLIN